MSKRPDEQLQAAFDAARAEAEQMPTDEAQARAREQFLSEARGESISLNGAARLTEQESALPDLTVQQGKRKMSYRTSRTSRFVRVAAAVLIGAILVGGLVWASPSLRALAQEIINFFVQGESDLVPDVVYTGEDLAAQPGEYVYPYTLTLEELAAQADFNVRLPTYIPAKFRLDGAVYWSEFDLAEIHYKCVTPWSLMIGQRPMDDSAPPQEVGASAVIEDVPIRNTIGQYVRGFWRFEVDNEAFEEARDEEGVHQIPATRVWSNEIDHQQLFWNENGISYTIRTAGGNMDNDVANPCALTKDDYAAIARGLVLVGDGEAPSP